MAKTGIALKKVLVEVVSPMDGTVHARKLIQIQLTSEALKFALIKVFCHNMSHEGFHIMNLKGSSSLDPRYNMMKTFTVCIL